MRLDDDAPPILPETQRQIEGVWSRAAAGLLVTSGETVRPFVRDSWARSRESHVVPELRSAPLVLSADDLEAAREASAWLPLAQEEVRRQADIVRDSGHILTLFDVAGRMLFADGDPCVLEAMQPVHFMPGGLWTESAVGTNGPGTALALARPVHVIGAEHFCAELHPWHCAAVPLHDPASGDVIGALDLSSHRGRAHPLVLRLALALGRSVEGALQARRLERQARLATAFAEMAGRYPSQGIVVVDSAGRVVRASPSLAARIPRFGASFVARPDDELTELPVLEGRRRIGACLLFARHETARRTSSGTVSAVRYRLNDLVGDNPRLVEAKRIALAAAANDLPVLILGESGVGKELAAQSIHRASKRAAGPFVAVNCAAIPRELVESELFGYVGGAFSGARPGGSPGKILAARGGTLFLDEVFELSPAAQAALLRVLQENEVTPVGATRAEPVDVRVIAATNREVEPALAAGTLRRDFYHRLNVLMVELPPLRERVDDLPQLVELFLATALRETGRDGVVAGGEVMAAFRAYDWPGNVRELQNVIRGMVATCRTGRLELDDLPARLRRVAAPTPAAEEADAQFVSVVNSARTMAEAASRLGMDRSTLYRRLEKYGLRRSKKLTEG